MIKLKKLGVAFWMCAILVGCLCFFGMGCGADYPSEGTIGGGGSSSGDDSGDGGSGDTSGDSIEDGVPFSSLNWPYGGVDGSGASLSTPRLSSLSCNNNTIYYKWVVGLNVWGFSHGDAGALACAFVQRADGSWVGGKFDWVSTSRASRGLAHILQGYGGWSLAGVPNPCQIAYVVVDAAGKRRSNVIGPVTWQR